MEALVVLGTITGINTVLFHLVRLHRRLMYLKEGIPEFKKKLENEGIALGKDIETLESIKTQIKCKQRADLTKEKANEIIQLYNRAIALLQSMKGTVQKLTSEVNQAIEDAKEARYLPTNIATKNPIPNLEETLEAMLVDIGKFNEQTQQVNQDAQKFKQDAEQKLRVTLSELQVGFGRKRKHRKTRKHRSRKHKKTRKH